MSDIDLDDVIPKMRDALAKTYSPGHPDRYKPLSIFASLLLLRFKQGGRMEDLEEAIPSFQEVHTLWRAEDPEIIEFLSDYGQAMVLRYDRLHRMEDLDKAIVLHWEAVAKLPPHHPLVDECFMLLATALTTRCRDTGDIEGLQEAIELCKEALSLCPPGHSNYFRSVDKLALALLTSFQLLGKIEDLQESISYNRQALDIVPLGHDERPHVLDDLAKGLSTLFRRVGRIEELEEAIRYSHEAVALCPLDHPRRTDYLGNLSNNLFLRFQSTYDASDLETAISHYEALLMLCPPGSPNRHQALTNLAAAYILRFHHLGKVEDLDKGIQLQTEALGIIRVGHPDRPMALNNLAHSLAAKFSQLRQMEDLEEAISLHTEALELRPPGHPDRAMSLTNLANVLELRYTGSGRIEGLQRSVALYREALELHPPGHIARATFLDALGSGLFNLFDAQKGVEYVNESIELQSEALELCPPGHPGRHSSLVGLAAALNGRFIKTNNVEDVNRAIALLQEVVESRRQEDSVDDTILDRLAVCLTNRYRALKELGDLDEAVKYHKEAEGVCPPHRRAWVCLHFARTMQLRYGHRLDAEDLKAACHLFEEAADNTHSNSRERLEAARDWASFARQHDHPSALVAYSKALVLLQRCLVINPTVEMRQEFLVRTSGDLSSLAASWAIEKADLETAVQMLETGRGLLWSTMRGYRHPIDRLREVDLTLAEEFDSTSSRLESLATSSASETERQLAGTRTVQQSQAAEEAKWTHHRVLSNKWDEIVDRIRKVEGFEDFLQAMPFSRIQAVAKEGPVIIVNISHDRSDAIILVKPSFHPVLVPLSPSHDLYHTIAELFDHLSKALAKRDSATTDKIVKSTLRSLWEDIVSPVVTELQDLDIPEGARIWWCPTGKLCSLPIHAAQPFCKGPDQKLSQRYVPSYTPTLSSLIAARAEVHPRSALPQVLAVGIPDGRPPLPCVSVELNTVANLGSFVRKLVSAEATPATVLAELRQRPWVHFACHGRLVRAQPLQSSFALHGDARLTIVDLMKARLPDAEFAFLSACHTAEGDMEGTPDEAIHLAAGMQFCGFRGVVGTLWAMEDEDGPGMAADFYAKMFENGDPAKVDFRDASTALRAATRSLRENLRKKLGKNEPTVHRWANFVHIGA
ncbi:TPR-like protein [Artomyces pyxidatus]|uniref:TPR-like protein n=1 Tax=Artomyces pyxidatus TaxID=48021 RepID=A0ACB8T7F9_9AGAM|nr:TPR-like protein [Artomyces pyxidatus]